MGLFDFITGGEEGQLRRHAKRMTNINAQQEDRHGSAHWLAENGSPPAINGLLGRFGVSLDSQMKDVAEKALVFDLLVDLGPKTVEPSREWLRTHSHLAMPIRLIEHFEGQDGAVATLLDLLARENDPFKTEKKRQILIKLAEARDPRIVPGVLLVLTDFDEGVRYAAVEALLAQDDPGTREPLAAHLADPEEDSNRLRTRIAGAFQQRRWSVAPHTATILARLPHGWQIVGDQFVPA